VTGTDEHANVEPPLRPRLDQQALVTLSDDELEAELTVAAYAPGRLRWDVYQRLLHERLRRRLVAA
jgi:hypothetical protein